MPSRLIVLAALLAAPTARAHDADVILVLPRQDGEQTVIAATLSAQTLALLAPIDADGDGLFSQADAQASEQAIRLGFWEQCPLSAGGKRCALESTQTAVQEGAVVLEARYACGEGELSQDFKVLAVLPRNYSAVLSPQAGQGRQQVRFPSTTLILRAGPAATAEVPPPGAWVWAMFLLAPVLLMLFERRRF